MNLDLHYAISKSKQALAKVGDFDESKHPRDEAGKFSAGDGQSSVDSMSRTEETFAMSNAFRGNFPNSVWGDRSGGGFIARGKNRLEISSARRQAERSLSNMGYKVSGAPKISDEGTGAYALTTRTQLFESSGKGLARMVSTQTGWSGGGKVTLTFTRRGKK